MKQLVVVGGGWAGCAAALAAAKKGLTVSLVERTDRLLASGLVGGIMRNNGRYTAAEELILMGAGELIAITDRISRHTGVDFPGHRHASLYDVEKIEIPVRRLLHEYGVELLMENRAVDVVVNGRKLRAIRLAGEDQVLEGEVFIDTSGTAGSVGACSRFGNGCAMCIYRCPTFGPRVSMAVRAGAEETVISRVGGAAGYYSGSVELEPSSLDGWLLAEVRKKGVLVIPFPTDLRQTDQELTKMKACRQYSSAEYRDNIILLDTGAVKVMLPFIPLAVLRQCDGFAGAIFRDPLGGGKGNSIRFSGLLKRDNRLMVPPLENLFVAGERAGLALGHTEAMVTGTLAGYNAWLLSRGRKPVELPSGTVSGELIAYTRQRGHTVQGRRSLYTLSGGLLWEHIQVAGLYATDRTIIRKRLESAGVLDLFA